MKNLTGFTKNWLSLSSDEANLYKSYTAKSGNFASPFLQFGFIQTIAKLLPDVDVLIICDGDKPVFFLPYQFNNKLDKLTGLATRIGSNMSDIFSPILAPELEVSAKLVEQLGKFNLLNFDHFPVLGQGIKVELNAKQLASQIIVDKSADYYFEWLKAYNKKFFSDTNRRCRKAVEALGEVNFTFNTTDMTELDRLVAKKRAQYARTNAQDSLAESWKQDLLSQLFHEKDNNFEPILSTLYCGETWLASHLGIKANGILQYWLPVYSTEHRNFAPGRLLLFENIKALQSHNISIIDRGEGLSDAKKDTANFVYQMSKGSLEKDRLFSLPSKVLQRYYWKTS